MNMAPSCNITALRIAGCFAIKCGLQPTLATAPADGIATHIRAIIYRTLDIVLLSKLERGKVTTQQRDDWGIGRCLLGVSDTKYVLCLNYRGGISQSYDRDAEHDPVRKICALHRLVDDGRDNDGRYDQCSHLFSGILWVPNGFRNISVCRL